PYSAWSNESYGEDQDKDRIIDMDIEADYVVSSIDDKLRSDVVRNVTIEDTVMLQPAVPEKEQIIFNNSSIIPVAAAGPQPVEPAAAAAGPDTHESLIKEGTAIVIQVTSVYKTIVDQKTGNAALPEIKRLLAKWRDLILRVQKIRGPTEQELKKHQASINTLQRALEAFCAEVTRVDGIGGSAFTKPVNDYINKELLADKVP